MSVLDVFGDDARRDEPGAAPPPSPAETAAAPARRRRGTWPPALLAGSILFGVIAALLVLAPWLAPYPPAQQDLVARLEGSSAAHLLGTDHLGRDVLSRLLDGGRFSLAVATVTLVICAVTGTLVGFVVARRGGLLDTVVMRVTDILLAFPEMVVALFLVAVLGTGDLTLVLALTIGGWTPFCRLARGVALEINGRDFIEAAQALGCSGWFIIRRHLLPNALPPLLAHAAVRFGHKLITVGALSFLGLGVQPPFSDWGSMLSEAIPYLDRSPLLVLAPGAAIFVAALSVTLAGRGLETLRARTGGST
ncbi:ABC transporter permease [Nonomuraea angiospora]|uniref:ABC transporter permease n=1 Tax=Nonomuraea angiospora TaxID=46172 RepID=UPI0029B049FA|nr:ABC transporter permease [Nonomuraea angiospora]MDX3103799.1 ABC transporter permease [Nonomuraea angiospora]